MSIPKEEALLKWFLTLPNTSLMPSVRFYSQDIPFVLQQKIRLKTWLISSIQNEKKIPGDINYIFCSDEHLYDMNVKYLNHDTYTDIITFDYSEKNQVAGDMFVSIDRVKENAKTLKIPFKTELHRVMVHGVLHLCGYKDKSPKDEKNMRAMEDFYLKNL